MEIIESGQPSAIEVQDAADFVAALKAGKTAQEAAESVGKPLPELLRQTIVRRRVEELAAYFVAKGEARDQLVDSAMLEILLTDPDARNRGMAAKLLKEQADGPLVNISISDEVRALKVDDLWKDGK